MQHGRIFLTRHSIDRFGQRFKHLCEDETSQIVMYQLIGTSVDNRSFTNNTLFMNYLRERYGYQYRYKFLVNGDVVFVVNSYNGRQTVVTCLTKDMASYLKENKKYKKQPKQYQNHQEHSMKDDESFDDFMSSFKGKKKSKKSYF